MIVIILTWNLEYSVISRLGSCFWPQSKAFKRRISAHFNSHCLSLTWWIFWQIMPQFLDGRVLRKTKWGSQGASWIGYGPNMQLEYIHTASLHNLISELPIGASKAAKVKNCFCFCPHWEYEGLRTGLLSNRGEVTVSNQARLSKGSVCNTSEFEARKSSSYSWLFCNLILTEGDYFQGFRFSLWPLIKA